MSSIKKLSPRLVLKENHPTAVKVAKLCDLAGELGISLSFYHQRVLVTDVARDKSLPSLYLEDIEENNWFESFPFETEYKLVYANPEFLAQEKQKQDEHNRQRDENARLRREETDAAIKVKEILLAQQVKDAELKMLATLKEKYKDE